MHIHIHIHAHDTCIRVASVLPCAGGRGMAEREDAVRVRGRYEAGPILRM